MVEYALFTKYVIRGDINYFSLNIPPTTNVTHKYELQVEGTRRLMDVVFVCNGKWEGGGVSSVLAHTSLNVSIFHIFSLFFSEKNLITRALI